jgi:hypothetical protein
VSAVVSERRQLPENESQNGALICRRYAEFRISVLQCSFWFLPEYAKIFSACQRAENIIKLLNLSLLLRQLSAAFFSASSALFIVSFCPSIY